MVRDRRGAFSCMRIFCLLILAAILALSVYAQSDLEKLVETERSFAKMAGEQGTKAAFLEYMAPDAVVFVPDKANARSVWTARQESVSLLSWAPNFADISSNGILGYTTGNWEYRAKGRYDEPTAFGNFITIWLRQPSGQYRWVVDIGVGHAARDKYSTDLMPPPGFRAAAKPKSAAEFANGFFNSATQGLKKAYERYAADDVIYFREGSRPGQGRKTLVSEAGKNKSSIAFAKRSVFFETTDLAYVTNTYQAAGENGVTEKGNSMQIWKFRDGRWQIVLDILKSIPEKQS